MPLNIGRSNDLLTISSKFKVKNRRFCYHDDPVIKIYSMTSNIWSRVYLELWLYLKRLFLRIYILI